MPERRPDQWATWLLRDRHGANSERLRAILQELVPIRDKVLENAAVNVGEVMLDVGAGTGMIAFAALDRVGPGGRVIFLDTSQELLDHCRALAQERGVRERCDFVVGSAEDLSGITDQSVDIVTTRSVVMYVSRKDRVFRAFYRVLKFGGRVSMYERINSFGFPEPPDVFWGYDVTPIQDIVAKVRRLADPPAYDVLTGFDERDLLDHAERAGFTEVHLEYHAKVTPREAMEWNELLHSAQPPPGMSLAEALEQGLSAKDRARFTEHLRPLVEQGRGTRRWAATYLSAAKS